MKLGQQLRIKQNQSLIMTPQLQQAIKLLQLSNIELAEFIDNAQLENPFLQDQTLLTDNKTKDLENKTPDICDNLNNTEDPLKKESNIDVENTFDTHLSSDFKSENKNLSERESRNSSSTTSAGEVIEKTLQNKISLREHLINQINIDFKDTNIKTIAIRMIDFLHPSGWFITPISEVAQDLNIDSLLIEQALEKLKKLEPSGIFSENLSECLTNQLKDLNLYNGSFKILLENLEYLPQGKIKQVSKLCDVSEEKIFQMIKMIKTLNPKPADIFAQEKVLIDQPDIIVTKSEKGWRIDLNNSNLPTVNLDEDYIEEINNFNLDEKGNNFAAEKIGEARWLKKAVEQRNKTILKVTSEIVKKQVSFFKHGLSHMKPMILKDISDAIGMHESTVSRVTNSKLILTEWGAMPLKHFFSASIASNEDSEMHAASAVRETIRSLISSEIASKPLSDDKLSGILSKEGMEVARRTVAKYRDMLNIPSSSQRRRASRLQRLISN
ncbi:RNA polymerase factor sigma-54 [Pseudomonadota bacterium]|nr:RNA polymerase factor sigma-54 [Pseudomonadota bacterium]